jgi:RNA polymerase sigma-70 factor (ECF subfamily)
MDLNNLSTMNLHKKLFLLGAASCFMIASCEDTSTETIENEGGQSFSNNLKSTSLDPEQKFIQQQRVKLMRTLMGQLSEKYRLMIELRYFEELSYEEIANELEIPLGTVKAQLFRAKEILYSLMQTPEAKAHVDWKRKKK